MIKRISAWIPCIIGLGLLLVSARTGLLVFALAAIPAALILAGGARSLFAVDLRAQQQIAAGAVLGLVAAFPLVFAASAVFGAGTFIACVIAFVAGGWQQIGLQPNYKEVPAPAPTLWYSALVAMDDCMLSFMSFLAPRPRQALYEAAADEMASAHTLFTERGWIDDPKSFHQAPPQIENVELAPLRIKGTECEQLRFASAYDPDPAIPGRDRWLGHKNNQTAHVLLLRHKVPGPWLVCVHGFGMGQPAQDFKAFRALHLYKDLGLNVALFTLPVHGPRAPGKINGAEFFSASALDFVHAESQAIWDLRRLIGWIRAQGATRVGVFGISLGGYTSSLLAGIDERLDCIIAAIPPADMPATNEYLASSVERRLSAAAGINRAQERDLYRVVSPLAVAPNIPQEGRFMIAATADQFVPIEQARALWLHWDQPRIHWSTGGHLSTLFQNKPRQLVDEALTATLCAGLQPQ